MSHFRYCRNVRIVLVQRLLESGSHLIHLPCLSPAVLNDSGFDVKMQRHHLRLYYTEVSKTFTSHERRTYICLSILIVSGYTVALTC